ncbi:hypothetical protein DFQ30_008558 [Apophysomyces sp. BC1015]|nr:hypothetical protein DFQ30_008558 [Apophysomyces sp. BC1015]
MRSFRALKRAAAWSTATAVVGTYYYKVQLQPPTKSKDGLAQKEVPLFEWTRIPQSIASQYVAPYPEPGMLWNMGRTAVMGGVGLFAKFFLRYLADTEVYGLDGFVEVVEHDRDRGLITGIFQPAVDYAIHKCNTNGWIHIYPEGYVNQSGTMVRFKWGVSRIIMESERCPLVIPIWHEGMQHVRPLQGPFVRLFQPVTVVFGDPIDFQDIIKAWKAGELSETEARIKITSLIYQTLDQLRQKAQTPK